MLAGKTIVIFDINEVTRDPRVRRVARSFVAGGMRVVVISVKGERREDSETVDGFELIRVNAPRSYMSSDMEELRELSPEATEIIAECNPQVMMDVETSKVRWFIHRAMRKAIRTFPRLCAGPVNAVASPLQERMAIRSILLVNLELFKAARNIDADIVYSNDLDTLLAGFMLKGHRDIPLVYDAHEIYPEQFAEHMRSDIWYEFYTALERKLIRRTDLRLTVCDSLGKYFAEKYGADGFITIRNCPNRDYIVNESVLKRRNQPRRIVYHGAFFPYRGLEEVLFAAQHIDNAQFVFRGIGAYEKQLRRQVDELQLHRRVRFENPVSIDQLILTASECDIGLNPFISVCKNTEYALPNKFFEYMCAGLAVVSADLIEMSSLTDRYSLGAVYDSNSSEALASCLREILSDDARIDEYRRNAWRSAVDRFNWENEEVALIGALGRIG